MQFKFVAALLFAAGINAAPSLAPRQQLEAIPLAIYDGAGCNDNPNPASTAFVPTDGSCFGISPIISGDASSAKIRPEDLAQLPSGCTITIWYDSTCSSVNFIPITTVDNQCYNFGQGRFVHSARTSGTC